jgi:pyridoxine/pyridoxamine 5'-phosphate oxidase
VNLQAYANHRKALGLRGTSHVAVINAYNDGRLSEPAVRREGRSWIINAELADEQWAARTDPSEYGGHAGGGSRPIGVEASSKAARVRRLRSRSQGRPAHCGQQAGKSGL